MPQKNIQIEPGEKIILEIGRHWFVLAVESLPLLILAIIPIVLTRLVDSFYPITIASEHYILALFFYTLWLLMLWVIFFINWTVYYLDTWILTNKRVFDIQQKSLFSREISVLRLEKIEDITIHVEGFFPTILSYGNVEVETAGAETFKFVLANISHPYEVKNSISAAHDASLEEKH